MDLVALLTSGCFPNLLYIFIDLAFALSSFLHSLENLDANTEHHAENKNWSVLNKTSLMVRVYSYNLMM